MKTGSRIPTAVLAVPLLAVVFCVAPLNAQAPAELCCGITAIDLRTGLVTARDNTTGRTFRFEVSDQAVRSSLKVGQAVWADHAAGKVALSPAEPFNNLTWPAGSVRRDPAEVCCNITAIDLRTGLVTARDNTTREAFQFRVTDGVLLRTLTIGQAVWADGAAGTVRLTPADPFNIVAAGTIRP